MSAQQEIVVLENAILIHGDAYDILQDLERWTGVSKVDALITDPPYANTHCHWDKKIDWSRMWELADKTTVESAKMILFSCGRFQYELFNTNPAWFRYDIIWKKTKKCGFLNARFMPLRQHETIMVFSRPGAATTGTYNPQRTFDEKLFSRSVSPCTRGNVYSVTTRQQYKYKHSGYMNPTSIIEFASDKKKATHATQKPVSLMRNLVLTYSNANEIVLDPFMGSGTTGIACIETNRRFIGIESDKAIFDDARKRIESAEVKASFLEPQQKRKEQEKRLFEHA